MNRDTEIDHAITDYIKARKRIIQLGERYPDHIGGNDNIIGRIGEYYAIRFLERKGHSPAKGPNTSNKGYDLIDTKTKIRTQVKVITTENRAGRTVRVREPWDQLLLITLDENYGVDRIGLLTKGQFKQARKECPGWVAEPFVKLTMLGPKGLIGKYGTVEVS